MADYQFDFRRYLNVRAASGPSFSPDGRRIGFLTNVTGVPQVWSVDVEGGWPEQLTFFPERVSFAEFSPSADRLAFGMDAGGNERQQLLLASGDGALVRPLTDVPTAIHTFGGWSRDGQYVAFAANRRDQAYFDVYVQWVADGQARLVYQQDGTNNAAAWRPDGRALVVSHYRGPFDHDLYLVGLDGAASDATHLTPHAGEARYAAVDWAPDGRGLYLLSDQGRDYLAPAYLDLATRELRYLDQPDWDVELLAFSPDGARLATSTNVDGYSRLAVRSLATGEVLRPEVPEGTIVDLKWSPGGTRLALTLSGPTRNNDVWAYDVGRQALWQVTRSSRAGIPLSSFVAPRLVRYPTFDGREIPALYYRPRQTRGGPAPVILYVHGGPESQIRPAFNPIFQYFLHRGYAIFAPNVRGSTGYGRTYTHLDDVRLRMDSVRDLKHAWEWLRDDGADPRRIAVMGGSYGGFMVLAAVTTYPDLWAAGVDVVGIANFVTFLEKTGPWRRRLREAEYGSLERDADFLREISPIHHVDRIRAPLMVVHGANDPGAGGRGRADGRGHPVARWRRRVPVLRGRGPRAGQAGEPGESLHANRRLPRPPRRGG